MEGHGPSWPQPRPRHPEDGRDGARPSREKTNGGPCSVMAAIHVPATRNLLDEITGAEHVSIKAPGSLPAKWRTRQSASLQGKTNGGPCSVMAAIHVPTTRNLVDEITGAEHVSIKAPGSLLAKWRTRRSACLQGAPHGGPRSLVPATPTTPPRRRTRRSASLHGKTNGGPCSVMAANHVPTTRNLLDEITGAKHVSIKAPGCMPAK